MAPSARMWVFIVGVALCMSLGRSFCPPSNGSTCATSDSASLSLLQTAVVSRAPRTKAAVIARASFACPGRSQNEVIWDPLPDGSGFRERGSTSHDVIALPAHCLSVSASPTGAAKEDGLVDRLPLIPYPASVEVAPSNDEPFLLAEDTPIEVGKGIPMSDMAISTLRRHLASLTRAGAPPRDKGALRLRLQHNATGGRESYRLQISSNGVDLEAPALAGLFYGVQTLKQLSKASDGKLPALVIQDAPRFQWRGLHLDVSRHFFSAREVMRLLDTMAAFKLNHFHWHLTDDQGWRLPIEGYPRLTEVGAEGVGGRQAYTAEEVKEVVAHARARHIDVMPEIDVPGHAAAAIAAYPELGNSDVPGWIAPSGPLQMWGVHDFTMAPTNGTLDFLGSVFDTVTRLFPSRFVHIGGDEATTNEWDTSAQASLVLRGEAPQSFFNRRVSGLLEARGRVPVGWDEVLHIGGLPEEAVVMAWRSRDEAVRAAQAGRAVVNADQGALYFDHYQGPQEEEPQAFCCYTPLEQVYGYEPMPPGLSEAQQALVLGGQGQLWSEYLPDFQQVEYMAHPRSLALAERLWTPNSQVVGFRDFRQRLEVRLRDLDDLGVNYRKLDNRTAL